MVLPVKARWSCPEGILTLHPEQWPALIVGAIGLTFIVALDCRARKQKVRCGCRVGQLVKHAIQGIFGCPCHSLFFPFHSVNTNKDEPYPRGALNEAVGSTSPPNGPRPAECHAVMPAAEGGSLECTRRPE